MSTKGKPSYEIKTNDLPPLKGFYFVLRDGDGNDVMESNVYDDQILCREGADEELKNWIKAGKFDG